MKILRLMNIFCSMVLAVTVTSGGQNVFGEPIETDSESGARVYLLGADKRIADNIYCEAPYGDPTGRWIAIRYFPGDNQPGGISILDLTDGSRRDVFTGNPRFPAFHAWGEYLYYQETVDDRLMLRRCRYATLEREDVAPLPKDMGSFSYGAVSPDHRYYAVCVSESEDTQRRRVHLLDLQTGKWRVLLDKPGYFPKHEQFSRDGRNRLLIQLNRLPDVKQVLLSELDMDGKEYPFPADQPHTLRPTGHECWIGTTNRIFCSTAHGKGTSIWTARAGDAKPVPIVSRKQFGHVSASRCGRYWVADTGEAGIPVYIGRVDTGAYKRLVFTRTRIIREQWSHAHAYLTADNEWLIFNSTRGGHAQVYGARLKPGWLDNL